MPAQLSDGYDLLFEFQQPVSYEEFDTKELRDDTTIQPVDFIVEFEEYFLFIEVKDPDNPGAENPEAIRRKLHDGKLVTKLAGKFRDTRYFFQCQDRTDKKIYYIVLLSMKELSVQSLMTRTDEIKKALPFDHKTHNRKLIDQCIVLNLDQFKKKFGENSVWRKSDFEN